MMDVSIKLKQIWLKYINAIKYNNFTSRAKQLYLYKYHGFIVAVISSLLE